MNIKKLVGAVSALTIAASTFAGLAVTASATTTESYDFESDSSVLQFNAIARGGNKVVDLSESTYGNTTKAYYTYADGGQGGSTATIANAAATTGKIVDMSFDFMVGTRNAWFSVDGTLPTTRVEPAANAGRILTLKYKGDWNLQVNDTATGIGAQNTWYHVSASFDTLSKIIDIAIYDYNASGDYSEATAKYTNSNLAFYDSSQSGIAGFDFYSGNASGNTYLDNVNIEISEPKAETAQYTVTKKCGEEVIGSYTDTGIVGAKPSTVNTDAIYNEDKTVKYVYSSDDIETVGGIASDGSTEYTLTYVAAEKYTATVNAVADGTTIGTFTNSGFEGDTVRVYYPKYVENNGVYYMTTANSAYPSYGKDFKEAGSADVEYTATDITYAAEFENLTPSHSWAAENNIPERCSNGTSERLYQNSYVTLDWTATKETEASVVLNARNNGKADAAISVYTVDADGNLTDTGIDFGTWASADKSDRTVTVTVPAGSKIALYNDTEYNSNLELDYVTVTVQETEPTTVNATNIGVYNDDEVLGTNGVATVFTAEMGDVTGTLNFAVTSGETTKTFEGATTLTDANAVLGIIVTGLSDADATGVLTVVE